MSNFMEKKREGERDGEEGRGKGGERMRREVQLVFSCFSPQNM